MENEILEELRQIKWYIKGNYFLLQGLYRMGALHTPRFKASNISYQEMEEWLKVINEHSKPDKTITVIGGNK